MQCVHVLVVEEPRGERHAAEPKIAAHLNQKTTGTAATDLNIRSARPCCQVLEHLQNA